MHVFDQQRINCPDFLRHRINGVQMWNDRLFVRYGHTDAADTNGPEPIQCARDIRHLKRNINLVQAMSLEGSIVHCRTQAVGNRLSHNAVNFSSAVKLH
jgi:hypothetical protein